MTQGQPKDYLNQALPQAVKQSRQKKILEKTTTCATSLLCHIHVNSEGSPPHRNTRVSPPAFQCSGAERAEKTQAQNKIPLNILSVAQDFIVVLLSILSE